MAELFRITRGLELDDSVQILQGAIPPGSTPDTDAAQRGSFYLDTFDGTAYTKIAIGTGTGVWSNVSSASVVLFAEFLASPSIPVASGNNSVAIGSGASATATTSLAIGNQSLARLPGGVVQASGRFGSSGDAQTGRYLLRTVTVNGAWTQAFIDGTGGTQQLVLPDNSTWTFTATITGHRTNTTGGHAGYKIEGVVYRDSGAGTIAFQGKVVKTTLAESNPAWDVTALVDTGTGSLVIKVLGEPLPAIIRWVACVETVEITN